MTSGSRGAGTDGVAEPVLDPAPLASLRTYQTPGGPDLAGRIVAIYLDESRAKVDALLDCLGRHDAPGTARAAHALKSASGNVGAIAFSRTCGEIEALARAGRSEGALALAAALAAEYARVRTALEAL